MYTKAKRHMDRKLYQLERAIEKLSDSAFLKVNEKVTISMDSRNDISPITPKEDLYFSKEVTLKRGPFKIEINSEHRGGEMYKNFIYVYIFGFRIFNAVWRTEKGNDYGFSIAGYDED